MVPIKQTQPKEDKMRQKRVNNSDIMILPPPAPNENRMAKIQYGYTMVCTPKFHQTLYQPFLPPYVYFDLGNNIMNIKVSVKRLSKSDNRSTDTSAPLTSRPPIFKKIFSIVLSTLVR